MTSAKLQNRLSALFVAAVAATVLCVRAGNLPSCNSPSCVFSTAIDDGGIVTFDMSSVCAQAQQQEFQISNGMYDFHVQICGGFNSTQYCNPEDRIPPFTTGVVVQTWGDPPCNPNLDPLNCNASNIHNPCDYSAGCTGPQCCTSECEVLATGMPQWSLKDPSNAHTGGILATFGELPRNTSSEVICTNGVQTVQFDFDCDWNKVTATLVDVTVTAGNKPKTCVFTFNFKSKQACFQPVVSVVWIVVSALLVVASLYVGLGMVWMLWRERRCDYPHREFWGKVLIACRRTVRTALDYVCCTNSHDHAQ